MQAVCCVVGDCFTAMPAARTPTTAEDLYERLRAAGKNGKVALIAVCNKLLKQAFAIATKGTTYQADFKSDLQKNKFAF